MVKKMLVIFAIAFIGIFSSNSSAVAGINENTVIEDAYHFDVLLDWDPVESDTWNYDGIWWEGSIAVSDVRDVAYWDVDWSFEHTIGPHAEDYNPNGVYGAFSYLKTNGGDGDSGIDNHPPHWDVWSVTASNAGKEITLNVLHTPEPVSSILFLAGGATLGFRRFRKANKV